MSCGQNTSGRVNRVRLGILVASLVMLGLGMIYASLAVPVLFGVLPLLLFAAACPAMSIVGKIVSWVRGGNEVSELQRSN